MNLARPAALLLLVAAVAGACVGTAGAAAPSSTPAPDPDRVVFRVDLDGGFVPPGVLLGRLPVVVVYADGRVITQGPQIEIYPGPLMPALEVRTLTPEGLARLVALARERGLLEDARYEFMHVSDVPTTVLTVTVDGETATISAYGLLETGVDVGANGMSEAERLGRANLASFIEALASVPEEDWADDGAVYTADALRVYASPYVPDPAIDVMPVAWPLADLGTAGDEAGVGLGIRCQVIDGADLDAVRPLLDGASALTPFRSGEADYTLIIRPLLPGESGC